MLKYLLAVLVLIGGAMMYLYRFAGVPVVSVDVPERLATPHFFDDPSRSIKNIYLLVFYFVPNDKQAAPLASWRGSLQKHLDDLALFNALQFGGRSQVLYEIYPEPIVGRKESIAYNTDVTEFGNPEGLRNVSREIEERVLTAGGDLYWQRTTPHDAYEVRYIVYEGPGASGSGNIAFINRTYLADNRFADIGASTFVHEFYHTLGVPDAYTENHGWPLAKDIMGMGRERVLSQTYLDAVILERMGAF